MGTETLTTFLENVKLQLGNNTAFASPTDFYTRWINRAYIRLTTQDIFWGTRRRFYFPQLETSSTAATADGVVYVSVPTDCLVVRDIYDTTNNRKLTNIPHPTYVGYTDRSNTSAEGKSTEWVRQGTYLYLHPTPDAIYTLRIYYRKIPAILSLGADATVLGTEWDEPIITLAAYTGKIWTMDYDKAKILKQEFLDQTAGLVSLYGAEEKARLSYFHVDQAYLDRSY